MQNGLFSGLPTISNWPARAELALASTWAARAGLVRPGDFAAMFAAPEAPLLWTEGTGVDAGSLREGESDAAPAVLAALAEALPRPASVIIARPKHARALATLEEPALPPICTEAFGFHARQAVLPDFALQPPGAVGARLARLISADTRAVILGGHGVLTLGADVAEALGTLLDFERASEIWLLARASGQALRELPAETIADLPPRDYQAAFSALKRELGHDRD